MYQVTCNLRHTITLPEDRITSPLEIKKNQKICLKTPQVS